MGFLEKGLIIYLCLAIACVFWQPSIIFEGSEQGNSVLSFIGINSYNQTTNEPIIDPVGSTSNDVNNSNSQLSTSRTSETSLGNFQFIVDPIFNAFGWVNLFFKVLFSPWIIFTSPQMGNAPLPIFFIYAVPIIFITLIGIIFFIRSGT